MRICIKLAFTLAVMWFVFDICLRSPICSLMVKATNGVVTSDTVAGFYDMIVLCGLLGGFLFTLVLIIGGRR